MGANNSLTDNRVVPAIGDSKGSFGGPSSNGVRRVSALLGPMPSIAALHHYKPRPLDIYLLGITIVIGGQYFSWNAGLKAGLENFVIAYFLMGSAYVVFSCCVAEITGALPFAGGAYGLSRCTLGFFMGYLVGCCEAMEYIVYVSTSVLSLAEMIINCVPQLKGFQPAIWFMFYATALVVHIRGDRVFWVFNFLLGVVSLVVVLIYCFGSLSFTNLQKHAIESADPDRSKQFSEFMKSLPLIAWFFVGIEALNLASDQVERPKVTIPRAQILCVVTLFVTGLMVLFVTVSLPPGLRELYKELAPFNRGFVPMFNVTQAVATLLSLPATYATAFGFMWSYGKLISAMAMSKLLPPELGYLSQYSTPANALVFGSFVSFVICIVVYYGQFTDHTFLTCVMCAFMTYTAQCFGYISLRRNYREIQSSSFRSPFGVNGAYYSLGVWCLSLLSVVGFQGNGYIELLLFLGLIFFLAIFYVLYARERQTFSEAERHILMIAHVIKRNTQSQSTNDGILSRRLSLGDRSPKTARVGKSTMPNSSKATRVWSDAE